MKLTVGSLPAAVYWRRRVVVLGGALAVVLLTWASCSGGDDGKARDAAKPTSPSSLSRLGSTASSPAAAASPGVANSGATSPASAPPPANPAPTTRDASCGDDEIQLTPVPESTSSPRGQELTLQLRVKNVASRNCQRDLGADAQELYLTQGASKIWSSDACDALHGTKVVTLAPGDEQAFRVVWDGRSTVDGCGSRQVLAAGQYQLVARLGGKLSTPVTLTLN